MKDGSKQQTSYTKVPNVVGCMQLDCDMFDIMSV